MGPIFNLSMAFSADRKDAIIDSFKVILRHENGEIRTLNWVGMSEIFSEITDSTGNRQVVSKQHTAIAFKIGTESLLEKFVRFQEPQFSELTNRLLTETVVHFKFLKESDPEFVGKTLQSKQFHDLLKSHKESFWWKPGKYEAEFTLGSPKSLFLNKQPFGFILSQLDVDALKENLEWIETDLVDTVKTNLPDYQRRKLDWVWRYVNFEKLE